MNIEQLLSCAAVLGEMSNNFTALPTDKENAVQAGLYCQMAQLYVLELAKHLTDGMEPYDAIVSTANGELELPESKLMVLKVLTAQPNK